MTNLYTHPAHPAPSVPVEATRQRYPVRRIFCVGRNYADHAREMGRDPDREPPFFFTKFPDSVAEDGATLRYPLGTSSYHYEMELVVALSAPLCKAEPQHTASAIYGYAAGLDMTRRDLQLAAREQGRPWDLGKSFEQSAVIGLLRPLAGRIFDKGALALQVNGTVKQSADVADMIWSVPEILSHLSQFYPLDAGDLVFTGTPAGVGAVVVGDRLLGTIEDLPSVSARIGSGTE